MKTLPHRALTRRQFMAAAFTLGATATAFDDLGLGQEPTEQSVSHRKPARLSCHSVGCHLDLILTDQHSYRSEDPLLRPEAKALIEDVSFATARLPIEWFAKNFSMA